jgi:hypothetical protein
VGVIPDGEALATTEAPTDKDTPPDLEYACGLHFIYTALDETFFRHDFDIPMSIHIHYPKANQGVLQADIPKATGSSGRDRLCLH